ncbi:MAG TPA: hypothetical protein VK157_11685 [Phycisphaerales bacterium]|nr:hypothetical protein [Phycisphaerales bacterium]
MEQFLNTVSEAAPWLGTALLVLIFLANAFGVLDQSVAARELTAAHVPRAKARVLVLLGRLLQAIAAPCLFIPTTRFFAAFAIAGFMIAATLTAHAFWKTPASSGASRDHQLAQFLKNVAIIGGLLVIAGWRG